MTENSAGAPSSRAGAIVLAAGASVRMGGAPKALLPVHGVPAVVRIARICSDVGVSPVVVVAGAHREAIRSALRSSDVWVVDNLAWEAGRTGSIQTGLGAVGPVAKVLLWPVDHPFVNARTVEELLARADRDTLALWVAPTFEGRGGHPILVRRELFGPIQGLGPDEALRSLLAGLGPQVLRVPVPDPGVVENVDTPEAYRRAVERSRSGPEDRTWTES
jgi:molybdenum cofactor cytidylyltransferase